MSVDFPAPFSPTSACTSPARRSNDTPRKARTPANDFARCVRRRIGSSSFRMTEDLLRCAKRSSIIRAMSSDRQQRPARDPYLVKSVVHSAQLLSAFRSTGEALPLREISARSGLPKSMTFRLLYTLERCGMIEKAGENLYRSHLRPFKQRPFRLGYAAQGTD